MRLEMDVTFKGAYLEGQSVRVTIHPQVKGQVLSLGMTNCSMIPASGGTTPWKAEGAAGLLLHGLGRGVSRKWR